jgi:hypothetical protein
MKRQTVARTLMLIGSGFIALAVIAFIAQIFPYPTPQGGMYGGIGAVGQDLAIFAGFWGCASVGALSVLGSLFLKLKWWWAGPLYFAFGVLAISQYELFGNLDNMRRIVVLQSPASSVLIFGFGCFVVGVLVGIAFWIVTASEPSEPSKPSSPFVSSPLNLQ